jgi:prepilin-type processing-associated H-X9-DG protein
LKYPKNDWLTGDGETQNNTTGFYYICTLRSLYLPDDFRRHGNGRLNFIFADGHTTSNDVTFKYGTSYSKAYLQVDFY